MNLGRAKLILVVAFTGLNIFLGYQLFWPDFGRLTEVSVTAEDLRETEQMLAENNLVLDASFDRSPQTSDFITVSPDWKIRQALLYDLIKTGVQIEETEHTTYYRSVDRVAVIHNSGLIQIFYSSGSGASLGDNGTELGHGDLKNRVEEFLAEDELLPEGINFDYLEQKEDGSIALNYHQTLGGMPIFSGQIKIVIDGDRVKAVEIYWLELAERAPPRDMEVISPAEALKNLVSELGPVSEERIIEKIDLGYYSGEYDAEKWEVPPVWRIVLDNNQYYYINAFTGNLEKDTVIPEQL